MVDGLAAPNSAEKTGRRLELSTDLASCSASLPRRRPQTRSAASIQGNASGPSLPRGIAVSDKKNGRKQRLEENLLILPSGVLIW
ncbi:hypothetical protein VTK73DRAFT_6426 [Phialemonium thermophilum]|uniref:Uncharacterized protein n=1 Tax=Phialemonium thermophilum TaxID=223376 RepID=A0ABR3V1A8_9PEZI